MMTISTLTLLVNELWESLPGSSEGGAFLFFPSSFSFLAFFPGRPDTVGGDADGYCCHDPVCLTDSLP